MLIDFCLPVRNEEHILAASAKLLLDFLVSQKTAYTWRIIIIVNGSQDNSYVIAQNLAQNDQRITARYLEAGGKGGALKTYFNESRADILAFMDIDLAVSLEDIPSLLSPLLNSEADLVIGSRLLPDARTDRSYWRSFVSRRYNALSRQILRHGFSDLQCGFKAFKTSILKDLQPYLRDNNWFFDTELVVLAERTGHRVAEIPVDWQESRYNKRKSKIRVFIDVWSFIKNLIYFKQRLNEIFIKHQK